MQTELDRAIAETVERLMQPGGPLAVQMIESRGVMMPMLVAAPPTLVHYFEHFCASHGEKEFLVDGDIRLSFVEVLTAARAVAGSLIAGQGVRPGDRIGIAARNGANWIIAYMGALLAGGVATLLNGFWTGPDLARGIRMVDCSLVLADDQRLERLVGEDVGRARLLQLVHDVPPTQGLACVLDAGGGLGTPLPSIGPHDHATILYTSGSTGISKGALSTHRQVMQGVMNYVAQSLIFADILTRRGTPPTLQPTTLMNVPLFHVTGEVPVMLQCFALGRKLVLMPRWDPEEAMRLIQQERVTYFTGVPLMSYQIATHPNRERYDLSSCTALAAGGAPRPVEHMRIIKKAMGETGYPLIGYGLTETNAVGCGNFTDNYLNKPASTGPASRPIVEVIIIDDEGNHLPQGERGEIGIRTIANFELYWGEPEATRDAFTDDAIFRTGDIGYLDEEGYLFIVDRKKDIIIRGGENISCAEVESAAYQHDGVAELSVFPVPDEKYGEVPALVYLAKQGVDLPPATLRGFMETRLAAYQLPQHVWQQFEPLPRLGTQKIDRLALRQHYSDLLERGSAT